MLNALCDLPFASQPDIEPDSTPMPKVPITKRNALRAARSLLRSYGMTEEQGWSAPEKSGLEHWRGDCGTAWFGGLNDDGPQLTMHVNGVDVHIFLLGDRLAAFDVAVRALLETAK